MTIQNSVSISLWIPERLTIPASSTIQTNDVALTDFNSINYYMVFWNDTEVKRRNLNLTVIKKNATVNDIVYNKRGDNLNISLEAKVTGANAFVEIVNNETFDVEVDLVKLILGL